MAYDQRLQQIEKRMRLVHRVWSWPGATALIILAMLPVYGPLMPNIEGKLWPVTTRIEFVDPVTLEPLFDTTTGAQRIPLTPDPDDPASIFVKFNYTKIRGCTYVSTEAKQHGVHVDFEVTEAPGGTRIPGRQVSQRWRLHTVDFAELEVYFIHQCNPYWQTYTKVFG